MDVATRGEKGQVEGTCGPTKEFELHFEHKEE